MFNGNFTMLNMYMYSFRSNKHYIYVYRNHGFVTHLEESQFYTYFYDFTFYWMNQPTRWSTNLKGTNSFVR